MPTYRGHLLPVRWSQHLLGGVFRGTSSSRRLFGAIEKHEMGALLLGEESRAADSGDTVLNRHRT